MAKIASLSFGRGNSETRLPESERLASVRVSRLTQEARITVSVYQYRFISAALYHPLTRRWNHNSTSTMRHSTSPEIVPRLRRHVECVLSTDVQFSVSLWRYQRLGRIFGNRSSAVGYSVRSRRTGCLRKMYCIEKTFWGFLSFLRHAAHTRNVNWNP